MKTKLLLILALMPVMANAHSGHQHHFSDIIFNPSMWGDHILFVCFIGIVLFAIISKIIKRFFPEVSRSIHQIIGLK